MDVEVLDSPLDDNIILGRSYMYVMKLVSCLFFHTMSFPHEGNIITIDQITYYDPKSQIRLDNVFPSMDGNQNFSSFSNVCLEIIKKSTWVGTCYGPPPTMTPHVPYNVCMMTTSKPPISLMLSSLEAFPCIHFPTSLLLFLQNNHEEGIPLPGLPFLKSYSCFLL